MAADLVTLAEFKSYIPGSTGTDADPILTRLIAAESVAIREATGREFTAITGANPRSFDIDVWVAKSRKLQIGEAATITTVTIKDKAGTTLETVAAANRVSLPRVRDEWDPITSIWFPIDAPAAASLVERDVIEINATWGYPSVPADIKEACAKRVIVRYLTDVAAAGTSFAQALDESDISIGGLLASAGEVVRRYSIP